MHVICVNYVYDPVLAWPDDLLARYGTLTGCAEALAAEGAKVTVLQRFHRDARVERQGVDYIFHADGLGPALRRWQVPRAFHRAIRNHCDNDGSGASVVHANGMSFALQLRALRAALPSSCRLIVQDHGGQPWPSARFLQRWGLANADGFLFTGVEQAKPWQALGMISARQPVYGVMEGSTHFRRRDRAAARTQTGLTGSPVVLWVGRLIALKDPLVVLRGFEIVLRTFPEARFYMVYSADDLLSEVCRAVAASPALSQSVTLLGAVPHAALENIYNSADFFVLGSHSEGSGYALAEAMACGVVPVVTDIPSFRQITGRQGTGGQITDKSPVGALWTPGDPAAFAAAFLRAAEQGTEVGSAYSAEFFEQHLSFAAIARDSMRAYREIAEKRARP